MVIIIIIIIIIGTRLRAGRSGIRIPAGARDVSVFQNVKPVLGLAQPLIRWLPWFFPVGKAAGA
jgi:hypothetical protein